MQTANLDLCKALYEVSGWGEKLGETDFYAVNKKGKQVAFVREGKVIGELSLDTWHKSIPAYDLGYLLRKLPARIEQTKGVLAPLHIAPLSKARGGTEYAVAWELEYLLVPRIKAEADTPEDAAAKLAIELFKQGILKKEAA